MRRRACIALVAAVATSGSIGLGQPSAPPAIVRFTYGGSGIDTVNAVTTDAVGNIYIAGRTTSRDLPVTGNAFQRTIRGITSGSGSITDGFVAKFAPDGRVVWATYLGGNDARMSGRFATAPEEVRAIAVGADGTVSVAGVTGSTDFPTTAGAFQPGPQATAVNSSDGFFATFNAAGSHLIYSTYIGVAARATTADAVDVDVRGHNWVLGSTGTQFPWTHDVSGGTASIYLGHFPPGDTPPTWTRLGSSSDLVASLSLDRFGRPHALTQRSGSVLVTQLDEAGRRANFTASLPTSAPTTPSRPTADLAIGLDGTILIAGLTAGLPPVTQAFQPQPGGNGDAFVAALNPQGDVEVLSYLGGSGTEPNRPRLAVDTDRQVHVALDTLSFDLAIERGVLGRHPDSPLYVSQDQGWSWTATGPGLLSLGRLTDFALDMGRDNVYALVNGALLVSGNRGRTWRELRRVGLFSSRSRLAIDPRDPATIYAGDSDLFRLDRGGETITRLRQGGVGVGGFRVESVAVSPHDGSVWVGTGNGIEVSVDRGATWTSRNTGLPVLSRVVSPRDWAFDLRRPERIVAGTDYAVVGTEDGGLSWQDLTRTLMLVPGVPERPTAQTVALDPADSRRIYAGTFNRGIIVTEDGGATWRRATPNLGVDSIAVDGRPPHDVFAAVSSYGQNMFGVMVSRDRGRTWSWSLRMRAAPTALAAGGSTLYAAGPTSLAPYVVRLGPRQGSYVPSFASYLMEDTLRDIATTPQGDSVLALNTSGSQADVVVVRIAR